MVIFQSFLYVYQRVHTIHCSFGTSWPWVVEVVACVAVNDAFVMKAWGEQQKALNLGGFDGFCEAPKKQPEMTGIQGAWTWTRTGWCFGT